MNQGSKSSQGSNGSQGSREAGERDEPHEPHEPHEPRESSLQFDHVVAESPTADSSRPVVTCAGCKSSIDTEYFDVNGNVVCGRCRTAIEAAAETPKGIAPLAIAGLFGLVAGIAGAVVYYAVIAIAHLEIGIIAILIGYMVGYAVRRGAGGRGGLRFQILAVALTYASVALAYTPLAVKQAMDSRLDARNASTTTAQGGGAPGSRTAAPSRRPGPLVAIVLLALIAALPVLVVIGSFPSGLISAFIILIGMRQAWRMTGAPRLQILGPYRVGAPAAPTA